MKYKIELTEEQIQTLIATMNVVSKYTTEIDGVNITEISDSITKQWHDQKDKKIFFE